MMENHNRKCVKDITTKNIITIDASAMVEKAIKTMYEKEVSMLVVMDNAKPVGILTSGDLFNSFYLHVGGHLPQTRFHTDKAGQFDLQREKMEIVKKRAMEFKAMKVSSIMNPHLRVVSEDATLIEAVHEMRATELRRLLAVNESGKLTGVVGRTKTIMSLLDELTAPTYH